MSEQHGKEHDHYPPQLTAYSQRTLTSVQNRAYEVRTKAIESLLTEKGIISSEALDAVVYAYEHDIGPLNGAKVVARAWADPAYKVRLLENGTSAVAELGFSGLQGEHLVVVENTSQQHNVIVCALCSCYPWPVLGLPPFWYKSQTYRSRVTGKPREVLHEFGLDLDESVQINVWNSSAETRYMVLPEQPAGTDHLAEDQLAALVTRDAMIGVEKVSLDTKQAKELSQRHVADMPGDAALPRKSGELLFQDPWEGCAFAMAVALCERGLYQWSEFQEQLIAELGVAEQKEPELRPTYYECWLAAFEALLAQKAILLREKIEKRVAWIERSLSLRRTRLPFLIGGWPYDDD